MNIWKDFNPARIKPNDFIACIEIPKGSKNKYELDKESGFLILDRILFTSTHYPANYGFIPLTYADDKDPMDVLVLSSEEIAPLSLVRVYPIGVLAMKDDGFFDYKVLAIPFGDPTWSHFRELEELPKHIFDEISHFFNVYKTLEYKETVVMEVMGRQRAEEVVEEAIHMFREKFWRGEFND